MKKRALVIVGLLVGAGAYVGHSREQATLEQMRRIMAAQEKYETSSWGDGYDRLECLVKPGDCLRTPYQPAPMPPAPLLAEVDLRPPAG